MDLKQTISRVYEAMDGSEIAQEYSRRHGINSAAVLTVHDDEYAAAIAAFLADRIRGKTVVEIGGGIGLLALHMGDYAKRVFCIEANPCWSSAFVACLLTDKPKNVSFLFGAADEFDDMIRGDVALFCTCSDATGMRYVAQRFAPVVIDVYQEVGDTGLFSKNELAATLRHLPAFDAGMAIVGKLADGTLKP